MVDFNTWALLSLRELTETPRGHRKKPESHLINPLTEANRLSTDRFGVWSFQREEKAIAELPKRELSKHQRVTTGSSGAKVYTISLPGFTLSQAQALATTFERNLSFKRLSDVFDSTLTKLLELSVRYSDKPRALFQTTPVHIAPNRWEFRAAPEKRQFLNVWGHLDTLIHAHREGRVLRFVYKTDEASQGITHRVRFRSVYEFDGRLSFFRGESAGRIRSYSVARCSEMMLEGTSSKYLLPTLALEVVVSYQLSKLFVRVVQLS